MWIRFYNFVFKIRLTGNYCNIKKILTNGCKLTDLYCQFLNNR
jgi:hypothetical protein